MALGKKAAAAMALLVAVVAVVASTEGKFEDPATCYCPCMKDQCMTIEGASKQDCAFACDKGCREFGSTGQPNPYEFCGF